MKLEPTNCAARIAIREIQVANFRKLYEPILRTIVELEDDDYAYPVADVPAVVATMRRAFLRGSYSHDGRAIRETCKRLGIKHTRKAMESYFNGETQ